MQPKAMVAAGQMPPAPMPLPLPGGPLEAWTPAAGVGGGSGHVSARSAGAMRPPSPPCGAQQPPGTGRRLPILGTFLISFRFQTRFLGGGVGGSEQTGVLPGTRGGWGRALEPQSSPRGSPPALQAEGAAGLGGVAKFSFLFRLRVTVSSDISFF